jgi:hypothetical protein
MTTASTTTAFFFKFGKKEPALDDETGGAKLDADKGSMFNAD